MNDDEEYQDPIEDIAMAYEWHADASDVEGEYPSSAYARRAATNIMYFAFLNLLDSAKGVRHPKPPSIWTEMPDLELN
jgi:hypothetical protein